MDMINSVRMIVWIIFENDSKLLLLLWKYRKQGNEYVFESVHMDRFGCADNIVCISSLIKDLRQGFVMMFVLSAVTSW